MLLRDFISVHRADAQTRTVQLGLRWTEILVGEKRSRDGVETTTSMVRMSRPWFSWISALALAFNGIYKHRPLHLSSLLRQERYRTITLHFW